MRDWFIIEVFLFLFVSCFNEGFGSLKEYIYLKEFDTKGVDRNR